jgi:hypothetical protein
MLIKPITVRIVAYGPKDTVAALRGRAAKLLKDEHGSADEAAFATLSGADAHAEIVARRLDAEVKLKKPTATTAGIAITLAEVNERLTNEWLDEMPVAKTCVVFATWTSPREQADWQLLIADGSRWSENRRSGAEA